MVLARTRDRSNAYRKEGMSLALSHGFGRNVFGRPLINYTTKAGFWQDAEQVFIVTIRRRIITKIVAKGSCYATKVQQMWR